MRTGTVKRKPLTEAQYQRIDQLLRDCLYMDFQAISERVGCHYSLVQNRNKDKGIRVFLRRAKPKVERPRTRVVPPQPKGNFL